MSGKDHTVATAVSTCLQTDGNVPHPAGFLDSAWLAPTVIVGICTLFLTTMFNIITYRRATAKEYRNSIIQPQLDGLSARISTPLLAALQNLQDTSIQFSTGFRQFRTAHTTADDQRRIEFAKKFQEETLDPARLKLSDALQRADQYHVISKNENWITFEDKLDELLDIMNTLQGNNHINIDLLDTLIKKFSLTVTSLYVSINDKIDSLHKKISEKNELYLFGMFVSKS